VTDRQARSGVWPGRGAGILLGLRELARLGAQKPAAVALGLPVAQHFAAVRLLAARSFSYAWKIWGHFSQGTDIGVRGVGLSKEAAFEQAAIALTAIITDPQTVMPQEAVEVTCEAPGAYKNVSAVVAAADQAKLSRKVARLELLVCIKG